MTLLEALPGLKVGIEIQYIDTENENYTWVYCLILSGDYFKIRVYKLGSEESKRTSKYYTYEITLRDLERSDWKVVE